MTAACPFGGFRHGGDRKPPHQLLNLTSVLYKLPRKRIQMKRLIGLNIAVALAAAFAVLGAAEKTEARTRLSHCGGLFLCYNHHIIIG